MTAKEMLDATYLEMRWRCLSLAADLDRIDRAPGGAELTMSDVRLQTLFKALALLTESSSNRAEQVQLLLSDPTIEPRP